MNTPSVLMPLFLVVTAALGWWGWRVAARTFAAQCPECMP
jgi:hypothetical protein